MDTVEITRLTSPGRSWFKKALDPAFPPQALGGFSSSGKGGLGREAEAWVITTVEWPTENYWGPKTSHGFQQLWSKKKMFFQAFGKEIQGLGIRTKKYRDAK